MKELKSETLEIAKKLIERPSITPDDAGCQTILAEHLEKLGFKIHHLPFGEVQNLWAIRGTQSPLFVYAGHTDVVPPGNLNDWETPPFTPTIKEGFLYGRGAADMKGGIAAMITACERFISQYPHHKGSIAFLITSDEEGPAKNGTVKVIEYLKNEGVELTFCIVGEPSSHETLGDMMKNGRRGSLGCTLKILGKQGHVAYPAKANNPIHRALSPLAELAKFTWDEGNEYFPATSFQISSIQSGTGAENVIPGSLECKFNFRFNSERTPQSLMQQVEEVLQKHDLQYETEWRINGMPFLTKPGALVSACIESIEQVLNITPTLSTTGGTSDGRFIASTGAEIIELGPINATIHCINECVKISDLDALSDIYKGVLERLLLPNED